VETLDAYFGNVCELDIVFNFQQVYRMLDELISGGEVLETSKRAINKCVFVYSALTSLVLLLCDVPLW
jgi:hypothetical protein